MPISSFIKIGKLSGWPRTTDANTIGSIKIFNGLSQEKKEKK